MFKKTIYLIRKYALGDVLWTEPVIRYFLKRGYKICLITKFAQPFIALTSSRFEVKERLSLWDKMIIRIATFLGNNVVINLEGAYEQKPKQHVLQSYFEAAGITNEPLSYPAIYFNETPIQNEIRFPYVLLHLESERNENYRQTYGMDWSEIIQFLNSKGLRVLQLGKNKKEELEAEWLPTKSYHDMVTLIAKAQLFIGLDSGPSHIAASLGIPSLLFFGSVNPQYRHLDTFKGFFLQQHCEFAGCYHESKKAGGQICQLVGDSGIPKCCVHTTNEIIEKIEQLFTAYQILPIS